MIQKLIRSTSSSQEKVNEEEQQKDDVDDEENEQVQEEEGLLQYLVSLYEDENENEEVNEQVQEEEDLLLYLVSLNEDEDEDENDDEDGNQNGNAEVEDGTTGVTNQDELIEKTRLFLNDYHWLFGHEFDKKGKVLTFDRLIAILIGVVYQLLMQPTSIKKGPNNKFSLLPFDF